MGIKIFYCHQVPMFDLADMDWLIQNPVRDRELEEELGEQVWRVEYDADHPCMQHHNRYNTCLRYGFLGATFEDEAILDDRCAIFPYLATNLPNSSSNSVPCFLPLLYHQQPPLQAI